MLQISKWIWIQYPFSHNHESGKWVPPILAFFQLGWFSTSMIYGRKGISSSILARPFSNQASKMIKHSSMSLPPGIFAAFGLLFRHLPCLLQVFTQLTTLGQFHDDHLSGVLNVSHRIFFLNTTAWEKSILDTFVYSSKTCKQLLLSSQISPTICRYKVPNYIFTCIHWSMPVCVKYRQ